MMKLFGHEITFPKHKKLTGDDARLAQPLRDETPQFIKNAREGRALFDLSADAEPILSREEKDFIIVESRKNVGRDKPTYHTEPNLDFHYFGSESVFDSAREPQATRSSSFKKTLTSWADANSMKSRVVGYTASALLTCAGAILTLDAIKAYHHNLSEQRQAKLIHLRASRIGDQFRAIVDNQAFVQCRERLTGGYFNVKPNSVDAFVALIQSTDDMTCAVSPGQTEHPKLPTHNARIDNRGRLVIR